MKSSYESDTAVLGAGAGAAAGGLLGPIIGPSDVVDGMGAGASVRGRIRDAGLGALTPPTPGRFRRDAGTNAVSSLATGAGLAGPITGPTSGPLDDGGGC